MDLADRQPRPELGLLQDDADPLPERPLRAARVEAEHRHLARVALPVALQDLDGRRLAGSVRPQQAEDLARGDLEVDPTNRLDAVVRLPQASDRDRRHGSSISANAAGAKSRSPGAECECDLRAVRLVADHDDRGARAFDGCEDVLGRRSRCEPFVDAQLDAGRFRDRGRGLAGAQERAREDGVGRDFGEELTQFSCLLLAACAQRSQRIGIAGVRMRMANEIEAS